MDNFGNPRWIMGAQDLAELPKPSLQPESLGESEAAHPMALWGYADTRTTSKTTLKHNRLPFQVMVIIARTSKFVPVAVKERAEE